MVKYCVGEKMKYIITSGPMKMKIDQVRSIENSSSGMLGVTIANVLKERGIENIVYIHTKGAKTPSDIRCIVIDNHQSLLAALEDEAKGSCTVIHAMAISDFKMAGNISLNQLSQLIINNQTRLKTKLDVQTLIENNMRLDSKLSSKEDQLLLFEKEVKVIDEIKKINPKVVLVGFKLLSGVIAEKLIEVATDIKKRANCDIVVANIKEEVSANYHHGYIITNDEIRQAYTKADIGLQLVNILEGK